ncbi:cyanase [Thalassospira sp.]|uniref:cyanase n=1 Tax=Thalassospira sp. TaxID=1912094 RepID=UPI002736A82C|nr:cyanase [Thalassospira sp.]MDP2698800.1 cyanase [Thalassospira sp.]
MKKADVKELILSAKKAKGLGWEEIASKIGMSPVWTTSVCLGMNSAPKEKADMLVALLALPEEASAVIQECPNKIWEQAVPTDPAIYRLYEIVGVYGETAKELIHEKFGDGIMSAIDFEMTIEKKENPKGDRVVVTLDGKFLQYRAW